MTGHHHTQTYNREILAEIWQKQKPLVDEEERIFQLLRSGRRLGLVGGSDTHDSMPGNPFPEPGCPRPASWGYGRMNEQLKVLQKRFSHVVSSLLPAHELLFALRQKGESPWGASCQRTRPGYSTSPSMARRLWSVSNCCATVGQSGPGSPTLRDWRRAITTNPLIRAPITSISSAHSKVTGTKHGAAQSGLRIQSIDILHNTRLIQKPCTLCSPPAFVRHPLAETLP